MSKVFRVAGHVKNSDNFQELSQDLSISHMAIRISHTANREILSHNHLRTGQQNENSHRAIHQPAETMDV